MDFSEQIKAIRRNCLMSQEAFAKSIGVSFATVNRWETGKAMPSFKTMKLIDDFCKENGVKFEAVKFMNRKQEDTRNA